MKPVQFKSFEIVTHSFEEPVGIWWPNATIKDCRNSLTSPVSLPNPCRSQESADDLALRHAKQRIVRSAQNSMPSG